MGVATVGEAVLLYGKPNRLFCFVPRSDVSIFNGDGVATVPDSFQGVFAEGGCGESPADGKNLKADEG